MSQKIKRKELPVTLSLMFYRCLNKLSQNESRKINKNLKTFSKKKGNEIKCVKTNNKILLYNTSDS